jgi:hypothetical protein
LRGDGGPRLLSEEGEENKRGAFIMYIRRKNSNEEEEMKTDRRRRFTGFGSFFLGGNRWIACFVL